MEYEHLSFVEAVEKIARQQGVIIPKTIQTASPELAADDYYELLEQAAIFYQRQLREYPQAINYLKQRGLSGKIVKAFGVGYATSEWEGLLKQLATSSQIKSQGLTVGLWVQKEEGRFYDRFRDRIMFPIRDRRGRVLGFGGRSIGQVEPKYLNSPETPVFHKGSELYGLYEACSNLRTLPRLLVVEGYLDVISLAQHGIAYAVATLGTATTANHIQRLFRLTQEVIFCFDGDRAGRAAAWKALDVALPLLQDGWQLRFLLLPDGEDPDSLVRKEGKEAFEMRITGAKLLADFLFNTLITQVDLNTVEGKAGLAKLAVPLIQKVPGVVLQQLLFERLSSLVRMEVTVLKGITHSNGKKPAMFPIKQKEKKSDLRGSPMRLAIALLLQNPQVVQSLTELASIATLSLPGSELLKALIELASESADLTTGALLEYWRDRSEKTQLEQLAGWEIEIPVEGIEQEFLGVINHLLRLDQEKTIEQLLQKASLNQLTGEEKQMLQALIAAGKPA
jgi:DNA primase